jgi:hypothetical protein
VIAAGGASSRGFVINRFGDSGIVLAGGGGNAVRGNFIGTDARGVADRGNGSHGCFIASPGNTVGGTTPGARNILSGNDADGIRIGGPGASGNWVAGNFIGSDVTGTADLGNGRDGIAIVDAPGNLIGGTAAGAGNVLSGNGDAQGEAAGVSVVGVAATGNRVQGNRIGTDAAGAAALGNSAHGVFVSAPGILIGGTEPGAGNVISGNGLRRLVGDDGVGVYLFGGGGGTVQGNSSAPTRPARGTWATARSAC